MIFNRGISAPFFWKNLKNIREFKRAKAMR